MNNLQLNPVLINSIGDISNASLKLKEKNFHMMIFEHLKIFSIFSFANLTDTLHLLSKFVK